MIETNSPSARRLHTCSMTNLFNHIISATSILMSRGLTSDYSFRTQCACKSKGSCETVVSRWRGQFVIFTGRYTSLAEYKRPVTPSFACMV